MASGGLLRQCWKYAIPFRFRLALTALTDRFTSLATSRSGLAPSNFSLIGGSTHSSMQNKAKAAPSSGRITAIRDSELCRQAVKCQGGAGARDSQAALL